MPAISSGPLRSGDRCSRSRAGVRSYSRAPADGSSNYPYNPLIAWPHGLCQLESLALSRPSGLLSRYNNRHIKHAASNT
jgi:hypothetical protein